MNGFPHGRSLRRCLRSKSFKSRVWAFTSLQRRLYFAQLLSWKALSRSSMRILREPFIISGSKLRIRTVYSNVRVFFAGRGHEQLKSWHSVVPNQEDVVLVTLPKGRESEEAGECHFWLGTGLSLCPSNLCGCSEQEVSKSVNFRLLEASSDAKLETASQKLRKSRGLNKTERRAKRRPWQKTKSWGHVWKFGCPFAVAFLQPLSCCWGWNAAILKEQSAISDSYMTF